MACVTCHSLRHGGRRILLSSHRVLPSAMASWDSSSFSTSSSVAASHHYKLLIVGGGTGGTAVANNFAKYLGRGNLAVVEPSPDHYYQPMWTLVGGGIKQFAQSKGSTERHLPKQCDWIREKAASFDPDSNSVTLQNGDQLTYDYLVTALGLQLNYHKIPGAVEALENDPKVCSNYSALYVEKTFPALQAVKDGNAIFTFPNTPIKCAGAPQKICYLADDYLRRKGGRDAVNIMYNTSLPVIFGIPRYAKSLLKIVEKRDIQLNTRTNLCEVRHESNEAVFELLDEPGKTFTTNYSMLHISPPCSAPETLMGSKLADAAGYVDVNRETMQHNTYSNVFAIGDCSSAPTAKTAAAVASQSGVVYTNLSQVMKGLPPKKIYDGYTSCPLVTAKNKCVLAEFGYDGRILETFPVNQSKERLTMYLMKTEFFPRMYWAMLIRGWWYGPGIFRKFLTLGIEKH